MPNESEPITEIDGSLDFSGGVNSYVVPTVASERNPNGLKRNQLAWMDNATVRGGGITQRPAWQDIGILPAAATGIYQGAFMYEPDEGYPYIVAAIGGHIWQIDPDNPSAARDLSVVFANPGSPTSTITDQVIVILTHNDAVGAATLIPGGNDVLIGSYNAFIAPAIANTVRVSTLAPYVGALGLNITIGGSSYTIAGIDGFTAVYAPISVVDLPATLEKFYFCQAEQFLIIQAGDLVSLPLIWDGVVLRKSLGFIGGNYPNKPAGYGSVHGYLPNIWTKPAALGTMNVTLDSPYIGNIGDYIAGCYGQVIDTSTNILTSYSTQVYIWVVSAIGPGNQITLTVIAPAAASTNIYNAVRMALVRLYVPNYKPYDGASSTTDIFEIPPATAMDYYMGRLWYAQGRQYAAGDIVGGANGTEQYDYRDSVLKVTENPLCIGGDGFTVPTTSGNIRAIKHSSNINTALGEGQLFIFTRKSIYSLSVPVTRTDWIGADTNNQPRQTVVQITNGAVSDRCIAEMNGDLFFQSFEPSIRSLVLAVRYYEQWGNTPISINEDRILRFNDRALMQFSSGLSFDNRMLQLVLPEQTPVGVAHRAVVPLNFDVISTLETKLPPVWEGMYEGQSMLELLTGDFGGRQRCFAPTYSDKDGGIHLWELSTADRFENGDNRVLWYMEFPAFTWGDEFELKKLVSAELWFDRIFGEVMFSMDYRPDGYSCWLKWHEWKFCTARNSCEDVHNPQCVYPKDYCESFRETITLPNPPSYCIKPSGRQSIYFYQCQTRLTIKGFCRVRGILLKAQKVLTQLYGNDMVG
jgi:hypothetical protein